MVESRFQLLLVTSLAVGFGGALSFALTASNATAFPTGPSVGYGSNPVFAIGGRLTNTTLEIATAPADQLMVITDVVLSLDYGNYCYSDVDLTTSGGETLSAYSFGRWEIYNGGQQDKITHAYLSGLPVPPGETLSISDTDSDCGLSYSISGYYAHP